MTTPDERPRCFWCGTDPLYVAYHDEEWGVPIHDDRQLFEMLILESFQAGLSWITILRKRDGFRQAFAGFQIEIVSQFGEDDIQRLLVDPSIIRHRGKIEAAIASADACLQVQNDVGSLDKFLWSFTEGKTIRSSQEQTRENARSTSPESDRMANELKKRGFRFMGSTTCYSFMQATGMVDDHLAGCWKYQPR